jgi:hypothetical protein
MNVLNEVRNKPEIFGIKNECESKKNQAAQTAAETENYGYPYSYNGGGSQHYGYAQTENPTKACEKVSEQISEAAAYHKYNIDRHLEEIMPDIKKHFEWTKNY